MTNPYAQETVGSPGSLLLQQRLGGGKHAVGEERRLLQARIAGSDLEIPRLELEHDGAAGHVLCLGAPGNALRHLPENALEVLVVADVLLDRGLRTDAFGLIIGRDMADVLAAGEVVEPGPHAAIAAHEVGLRALPDLADE